MPYRFNKKETFKSGFQRIVREELGTSQKVLDVDVVTPKGVHSVRKSLKRLRSLLRLVSPAIGKVAMQKHNREIRDIARLLATRRDSAVLQQTLQSLKVPQSSAEDKTSSSMDKVIAAVEQALRGTSDSEDSSVNLDGHAATDVQQRIEREAKALAKTPFTKKGFDAIRDGLSDSYRTGRKKMTGSELNPDSETFHELRKCVQWHWHQMKLLSVAWPELFEARAETARNVSQLLGEDHDLAVLNERVQNDPALTSRTKRTFADICGARQQKLRKTASVRIQQLFLEKPGAFTSRIEACWHEARRPIATEKKPISKARSQRH